MRHSLINGHILNRKLRSASRLRVIQNGKVDGFYGTRVEPTFVKFLNRVDASDAEIFGTSQQLKITLADGEKVDAFVASGGKAEAARKKFAHLDLFRDEKYVFSLFAKLSPDDPRVASGTLRVEGVETYMPSHWVAAMVKAGFLASFEMLGYSAVFSPWSLYVRNVLNNYYQNRASREDAAQYFHPFRNAVKFIMDADRKPIPLSFDTLETRHLLIHQTMGGTMFAATYIFKVNGATITVTLPETVFPKDVAIASEYYERLMEEATSLKATVHRGHFAGDHWKFETTDMGIQFTDALPRASILSLKRTSS